MMNRRRLATALAGGAAVALGARPARHPKALAGGWATLEFLNPLRVAVVDVPVVIDAQVLQHGTHPSADFPGAIRFLHETSRASAIMRLELISDRHAIVRGEHTFTEAGLWRMATHEMGPDVDLGSVQVIQPKVGEIIAELLPVEQAAVACANVAGTGAVETQILDAAFAEPLLQVAVGTTVQWMNMSEVAHQVVFKDPSIGSSGVMRKGDTFRAVFTEPGEFSYICGPHPSMTGVVTVTEG